MEKRTSLSQSYSTRIWNCMNERSVHQFLSVAWRLSDLQRLAHLRTAHSVVASLIFRTDVLFSRWGLLPTEKPSSPEGFFLKSSVPEPFVEISEFHSCISFWAALSALPC